jgi:hypothetical protein
MKCIETLSIANIRLDGGTQPRATIDFEAVFDYMDAMVDGAQFPPVIVFYDGTSYWLADGFHRVKATEQDGKEEIACDLRQGSLQDAQWYSFGANKTNGLRRTNQDKQRAVKSALQHPSGTVLSDGQLAKHLGVSDQMVRDYRHEMESTSKVLKSTKRRGRDGRTIDVTNIGETASQPGLATEPTAESAPATTDGSLAPEQPTSAGHGSTNQNLPADIGERAAGQWCRRVHRAATQIAKCPVTAKNLAVAIRRSPDSNDLITQLEKTHDFIATVLAEAGND